MFGSNARRAAGQIECKLTMHLPAKSGNAHLLLCERDSSVWIDTIFVPAAARQQGAGTTLMQRAVAYADALGLDTELLARPIGGHGIETTQRLVRFYQRFGFRILNPTMTVPHMRRSPSRTGLVVAPTE